MRKVREEAEKKTREEVGKKMHKGQSIRIKEIHANMAHDLAMAKLRILKKKPSMAKRGETEKKLCKKMEKRVSQSGWLGRY